MLLSIGNGALSWSEQLIPSGIAALLVAVSPLWFVLIEWMQGGVRPTGGVILGLVLGTVGIAILIDPADLVGGGEVSALGAAVLLGSSLCWAAGSFYSRRALLPSSPAVANGMEMLIGGVALILVGAASGELNDLHLANVTGRSLLAVAYLVVFGSIIGFSSYIWLFRSTTPTRASTYAYVNPVVAVFIGWSVGGEELPTRVALAAVLIIAAVAAITVFGTRKSSKVLENLGADGKEEAISKRMKKDKP
jgi:drug/metabolite transporter (DMT)-like permease